MKALDQMSAEELREEVAWLRHELALTLDGKRIHALMNWAGLTEQQAHLVATLYQAARPMRASLLIDLLPARERGADRSAKQAHVVICAVRKKWGADAIRSSACGYELGASGRQRCESALNLAGLSTTNTGRAA